VKLNEEHRVTGLRHRNKAFWAGTILALSVFLGALPARAQNPPAARQQAGSEKPGEGLAREVRHQLAVVPYLSVFDHIAFTLDGSNVTLTGQVVRPTLKSDAEAAVKSIEGVGSVVNQIEVLPASATDDDLRNAVYRAIYEDPELSRYAVEELPSIHIIIKNGKVTLEGQVESEADKNRATARADFVTNVTSVKNDLVVQAKVKPRK
jgi:hyperosmotically inducible periplasmic protein